MKKSILCVLTALVAGSTLAADIRYKSSGDWFALEGVDGHGWQSAAVPGTNDIARFNWGGNTVTLANVAPDVKAIQAGVDSSGTLQIDDGGSLTTISTSKVGNNGSCTGTLIVNQGGSFTNGGGWLQIAGNTDVTGIVELNGGIIHDVGHMWMSTKSGSSSTITISDGIFSVGGMIGLGTSKPVDLGNTGGIATINVNGGVLALGNIHSGINADPITGNSIRDGSVLNVALSGKVTLPGNHMTSVSNYVARGSITGNGITNNVNYVLEDVEDAPGITNTYTVVTADLAAVPSVIGQDLGTATNTIDLFGFTVGNITTGYLRGATSGDVVDQDPIGGTQAAGGSLVDLEIQEDAEANVTNISWLNVGPAWTNDASWSGTIGAPLRETQYIKANIVNTNECVLDTAVGVAHLSINGGNVRLASGGDLYAGQKPTGQEWTAVGYSTPSTLLVESNAVFEAVKHMLFGFLGTGESSITIDGGTVKVGTVINMGQASGASWGVININKGGVLQAADLSYKNTNTVSGTDCVINITEGSLILGGNETNNINGWMTDAKIVVLGTASTLEYDGSKTTLTVTNPAEGFEGWAAGWGEDIGDEENDHDLDGANNLYEYALNGDPTDDQDPGQDPVLVDNGGALEYTHLLRADDSNLVYAVETRISLTTGSWTNIGSSISGTDITGGDYNVVTNIISTVDDQSFIRLKIENP